MAAPLAPEVKEKITQPGLGTIMLIPGNLNAKLSTKAKGQLYDSRETVCSDQPAPNTKYIKAPSSSKAPPEPAAAEIKVCCSAKAESHFCPLLSKLF